MSSHPADATTSRPTTGAEDDYRQAMADFRCLVASRTVEADAAAERQGRLEGVLRATGNVQFFSPEYPEGASEREKFCAWMRQFAEKLNCLAAVCMEEGLLEAIPSAVEADPLGKLATSLLRHAAADPDRTERHLAELYCLPNLPDQVETWKQVLTVVRLQLCPWFHRVWSDAQARGWIPSAKTVHEEAIAQVRVTLACTALNFCENIPTSLAGADHWCRLTKDFLAGLPTALAAYSEEDQLRLRPVVDAFPSYLIGGAWGVAAQLGAVAAYFGLELKPARKRRGQKS
jgi:hypothetical protein